MIGKREGLGAKAYVEFSFARGMRPLALGNVGLGNARWAPLGRSLTMFRVHKVRHH